VRRLRGSMLCLLCACACATKRGSPLKHTLGCLSLTRYPPPTLTYHYRSSPASVHIQDHVIELCSGMCIALELRAEAAVATFRQTAGPWDVEMAKELRYVQRDVFKYSGVFRRFICIRNDRSCIHSRRECRVYTTPRWNAEESSQLTLPVSLVPLMLSFQRTHARRPDTLRGKYGVDRVRNALHCTDLESDAVAENEYCFKIMDGYTAA